MLVEVVLTLVSLCALIYLYFTWQFTYWRKRGVPFVPPKMFFGNFKEVVSEKMQIGDKLEELYFSRPNDKMVGAWSLHLPVLVLRDPELIKNVLIRDFDSFPNHVFSPDLDAERLLSRVLFSLDDDTWKTTRNRVSPVFTSGKLKGMFPLVLECVQEMVQVMKKEVTPGELYDVRNICARYAVDVNTSCACGNTGEAMKSPETSFTYKFAIDLLRLNKKQNLALNVMFYFPFLKSFLGHLGVTIIDQDKSAKIEAMLNQEKLERDQNGKTRNDAFGLLLQLRDKEKKEGIPAGKEPMFDGVAFAAQAFQFVLAGSETVSSTTTMTLYGLSRRPDFQARVRDEIRAEVQKEGGQVTYDAVHNMPLLDMAVRESLRLWPVLPFLDRVCVKNYRVPGTDVIIEKGTNVYIPASALQRDPKYFPDPDQYKPERFSGNSKDEAEAFLPFGAGPRHCIGKRFGLVAVKAALCYLLLNYDFSWPEGVDQPKFLKSGFTLNLEKGMPLILTPVKTQHQPPQPGA